MMIRRSIVTCLAIVLVWHFVMPHLGRGYFTIPGHQRANDLHAQRYVHDAPLDVQVIVGSSMAARLDERKLGADKVKLTFPGGGAFTGLEIIRRTGKRPAILWIETNLLLRDADAELLADALAEWRVAMRRVSPVFREEGRPSNFGIGFLKAAFEKVKRLSGTRGGGMPVPSGMELNAVVYDGIMKANRSSLDVTVPAAEIQERMDRLDGYVREFSQSGCRVVFFEMPFHSSLVNLAQPVALRRALKQRFPPEEYDWLDLEVESIHPTSDGIHLVPAEADLVVDRLLEYEKSLK